MSAGAPPTVTRPSTIADCAASRLGISPRRTSSTSRRRRVGGQAFLAAEAFFATVFLAAVVFRAAVFLTPVVFLAAVFLAAVVFRAVVFFAEVVFLAAVFLAAAFLAGARRLAAFLEPGTVIPKRAAADARSSRLTRLSWATRSSISRRTMAMMASVFWRLCSRSSSTPRRRLLAADLALADELLDDVLGALAGELGERDTSIEVPAQQVIIRHPRSLGAGRGTR